MTAKSLSPAAALWSELVDTAMLGTDRRPLPAPPAGPFGRFGLGSDAVALLDRAAAVQAARRAGAVPEPAGLPLTPCPPDDRVQCPGPAAARLGAMLAGRHADLLGEWLAALRAADLALPPEHLAVLVERTRDDPDRFRMVSAAAGSLLSWLSALLPALGWPTTSGEPPEEAWERGTAAERVAALRAMRAADPASVNSRLSGGLPGERVDVRAACYATLAVGLSPADEGLLERALDDRGSAVREVAAGVALHPADVGLGRPHGAAGPAHGPYRRPRRSGPVRDRPGGPASAHMGAGWHQRVGAGGDLSRSAPAPAGGRRHAAGGLGGHVRRCAPVGAGE